MRNGPAPCLILLTVLAACGGSGSSGSPESTGMLAYVVTQCREDDDGFFYGQKLQVRRGPADPITVSEIPTSGPIPSATGICQLFGEGRWGSVSVAGLPFQRLAVSPDGSRVVFEVTDEFSIFRDSESPHLVSPDQQGIYVVGADGSGVRRIGPASRDPIVQFSDAYGVTAGGSGFSFSPSGHRIAYTDLGPDRAGNQAVQIVTRDLETGEWTQVTHLNLLPNDETRPLVVGGPVFLDDETIKFAVNAAPAGSAVCTVSPADGETDPVLLPQPTTPSGSSVIVGVSGSPGRHTPSPSWSLMANTTAPTPLPSYLCPMERACFSSRPSVDTIRVAWARC